MMNAGPKRASISAILIFADLRQVTNRIAEAHHHSILADDVQLDRRFLLSSHESTSRVRPIERSALRARTCKGPARRQQRSSVACSASGRPERRADPDGGEANSASAQSLESCSTALSFGVQQGRTQSLDWRDHEDAREADQGGCHSRPGL
jgi:hypothetical protein